MESSPAKKKERKRIEFPDDLSQVKAPEPRKRQRVPYLPSAPAGNPSSTTVALRHEGAVAEIPAGDRPGVVGEHGSLVPNKDPLLLSLSYEKYLEYYELVEAAWRLRKVEDLFISTSTQYQ